MKKSKWKAFFLFLFGNRNCNFPVPVHQPQLLAYWEKWSRNKAAHCKIINYWLHWENLNTVSHSSRRDQTYSRFYRTGFLTRQTWQLPTVTKLSKKKVVVISVVNYSCANKLRAVFVMVPVFLIFFIFIPIIKIFKTFSSIIFFITFDFVVPPPLQR